MSSATDSFSMEAAFCPFPFGFFTFCFAGGEGKQALGWDPLEVLAPLAPELTVAHDIDLLVKDIAARAKPGDHIVVMSNGGFGGIHDKLLAQLERAS